MKLSHLDCNKFCLFSTWYKVSKSNSCQGYKAIVKRVKPGPNWFNDIKNDGWEHQEEEEQNQANDTKVQESDTERGVKMTESGVHDREETVDRDHDLVHSDGEEQQGEGDTNQGIQHTENLIF